ncbi:MAG: 2-oxoglutarate and iron-dependent oxygenase domain-containing protein [Actinomycetota bacterium]
MSTPATDGLAVPIDLEPWFSGDDEHRDRVAAAVDEACATSGFLAITGHGVAPDLMRRMLDVSGAFFDLPVGEKLRYHLDDVAANRGYAPFESEALAYSLGLDSEPDLFEAFNIGRDVVPDGMPDEVARTYFSPNVWPTEPADMRDVFLAYWDACESLGRSLCEVFARALGLAEGYFAPYLDRTPSVMRVNNYERRPEHGVPKPEQLRMGAHSDYGSLTVLLADPVPGFQIQDRNGDFHDVIPPEGAFLVNLGDLLAEWTNDRWRSTVHRVVPPPGDQPGAFRRRSVAWFQQPNHDAVIEVLDVCCGEDNPPRYPPTTSGEHLMAKLMGPRAGAEVDVDAAFLAGAD